MLRPVDNDDFDLLPDVIVAAGGPALCGRLGDDRLTADPFADPECFDASTLRPGITSVSHANINS